MKIGQQKPPPGFPFGLLRFQHKATATYPYEIRNIHIIIADCGDKRRLFPISGVGLC